MNFSQLTGNEGLFCDGDWIEKKDQDVNGNVRLIQLTDIGEGTFKDKSSRYLTEDTARRLNCTFLQQGDILIARLPDPLGRACIFPLNGKFITAVDIAILRIKDCAYNPRYVMYMVNSPQFRKEISRYESGTTRKRISRKNLDKIQFNVPDLSTQEHIVSKIEELFSKLDASVAELQTAKEKLKVYRQAVLFRAFQNLADTITMDQIADMIDPQPSHRTPPGVMNGIPYIGVGDIDYSVRKVKFGEARKVSPAVLQEHLERYTLHKGDFIMGKIGTIGKPFIVPLPQDYTLSANVILIQPDSEKIVPEFLYWQFSSPLVTQQLTTGAAATSQPAFGIKKARLLSIKMCSVEQQRQIVSEIEGALSICDSIQQTINTSLQQAEALRQSILKQAFEGRLV